MYTNKYNPESLWAPDAEEQPFCTGLSFEVCVRNGFILKNLKHSDMQAEHGDQEARDALATQSVSQIVGDNSVKVQENDSFMNKFKYSDFQAEHSDLDASDAVANQAVSHVVGDSSVKVQENNSILNDFKHSAI